MRATAYRAARIIALGTASGAIVTLGAGFALVLHESYALKRAAHGIRRAPRPRPRRLAK